MQVIILTLVLGTVAAVPERSSRIVGGSPTTIARYPFMSNMQYAVWGFWWTQVCGGSLITTTAVLSAAHCYDGDSPSYWRVVLGSSFASGQNGTVHQVSKLIVHENFDIQSLDYDVAIVQLSTPATLSKEIGLARVPGPNYDLPDGLVLHAIGWGALASQGEYPEQLQHVDVNIVNQEICAERYANLKAQPEFHGTPNVTSGMLCAGILNVGGKDACQGDSGGPVTHDRNVIVGITSWGYKCADRHYPGVNTRVPAYTDWIANNVDSSQIADINY